MAPEVLKRAGWDGIAQSQGLDQRADIYSLGAVLYEMLCGETPHARYHKLFDGILNHMPEPLSARLSAGGRDAPRRLLDTVLACLAKDPAGRPQSWALLARELEECEREALREEGLSACAGCGFAALPGRTPSPCPVCEGNDWRGLRTVIRRPPELPPPPPPTGTASRKEEAGTEELRPRPSPRDAEAAQVADKLGFILIPGGRAPAGCNRTRFTDLVNSGFGSAVRSLETPAARNVNLPAFEIAQIPVTAEAYRAFERATGYVRTAKGYVPSGDPNLPVVHVAVPDAEAFCDWLGCRLPTPEEWEKAARGFDGRAYPWGNEFTARKCTCREGGATGPTSVFAHPDGKSPFGVWDCVGNVAELADGGERGGRYALGGSYEDQCELYGLLWGRITRIAPDEGYAWVGFRTVRDPLVRVDLPPWKERFVRVEGTVAVGCDRSLIPLLECRMPLAEELLESLCANPLRMLNVPAFDMARFPVTNEDYWEFTQATHRASPASWARQPFPWNRRPFLNQRKFHPVTHVSQADAQAFCRWLGDRDGHRYRLPTGVEWEAAARGSDDRAYPWGDAFDPAACNGGGSAWQRTVDVREYPTGDSPWGCRQMAGNVFEWLSEHDSRWWHMRGGSYQSLGEAYGLVFLDLRTNVEADEGTGFRIVREVSNR
jgi:formylglycine-generating enzyme required for sulfatase activity